MPRNPRSTLTFSELGKSNSAFLYISKSWDYPDSSVWWPMHWGHAISKNLITWEHLPIALYPDSLGWIFSGSAVIDWKNTTKLGKDGKPAMMAIYTYHNDKMEKAGRNDFQSQGLAYSLIIDKSSVELFVNDGELVMTNQFFPTEEFTKINLLSEKGEIKFKGGTLDLLKSIW